MGLDAPLGATHQRGGLSHIQLLPVTHQEGFALTCRQAGNFFLDYRNDLGALDLVLAGEATLRRLQARPSDRLKFWRAASAEEALAEATRPAGRPPAGKEARP